MKKKMLFIIIVILFFVGCSNKELEYKRLFVEDKNTGFYVIFDGENYFGNKEELSALGLIDSKRELEIHSFDSKQYVSIEEIIKNEVYKYTITGDEMFISIQSEHLIDFREALNILVEGQKVKVRSVDGNISFYVRRVEGGYATIADVEPLTKQDTDSLLVLAGGSWGHQRIPIVVEVEGQKIAASISPFPHSGREDMPFGKYVDNRSGHTGSGINLNSIQDNGVNGVVDIYFYNSLTPGLNRVDTMHQSKILEATHKLERGINENF